MRLAAKELGREMPLQVTEASDPLLTRHPLPPTAYWAMDSSVECGAPVIQSFTFQKPSF